MTRFDDIEHRCFPFDDMMQIAEPLFLAMVADENVAAAWEGDVFLDMSMDQAKLAMERVWNNAQRECRAFCNRRFYLLNIERTQS